MKSALAAVLLCVGTGACQQSAPTVRLQRTVILMGTTATFVAEAPSREAALARLERMVRTVEAAESELSTWRNDSALSAINRQAPGQPLPLTTAMCEMLGRLERWRRDTSGAFDPAIGSLIDAWDLRGPGRQPEADALTAARTLAGWPLVGFHRESCTLTRRAHVTLDAGAFGKGEALDRVRAVEEDGGGGWFIDFGGQMAVSDAPSTVGWPIALAHPVDRDKPVMELQLNEGSLATSGAYGRTLQLDGGERVGHILDPRTGAPVVGDASVTVWHPNAFTADVLSTALYVMGPETGLDWAAARGFAACYIIPVDGSDDVAFLATPAFEQRFPL